MSPRAALLAAVLLLQDPSPLGSLIGAEVAFARQSGAIGVRSAFLEVLADDGLLFRPGPVNGREWMRDSPNSAMQLSWYPAMARVSAAGDLGFTTGPFRARIPSGRGIESSSGYYLSVWRREAGRWRLLLDLGVQGPAPDEPHASGAAMRVGRAGGKDGGAARLALLAADEAWARRGRRDAAAAELADPAVRLLRDGRPLAQGPAAAAAVLRETRGDLATASSVGMSASLDFAYTLGERRPADDPRLARVHVVRVWATDPEGHWRLLAEVEAPEPR